MEIKPETFGSVAVRKILPADHPTLEDYLYHAIFIPLGMEAPSREIIRLPEIYVYIDGFGGRLGDLGVVAEADGKIVGAAWTRIISAYGHIDAETPELAISILPGYRGQGIGTKLMTALFDMLRENGFKQTSLSVQTDNPAVRFYLRLGYKMTGERPDFTRHTDYLMVKDLTATFVLEDTEQRALRSN